MSTFASISQITSPVFCVCIANLSSSFWKFWNFAHFLGYFRIKLHSVNVSFEPNVLFNITCIARYKCTDSKRRVKLKNFRNLLRMLFYLYFIAFVIQISRLILFLPRTVCFPFFLRQHSLVEKFCESMLNQSVKCLFFLLQKSIPKKVVLHIRIIHKISIGNY